LGKPHAIISIAKILGGSIHSTPGKLVQKRA
jgi:hypothetical protein